MVTLIKKEHFNLDESNGERRKLKSTKHKAKIFQENSCHRRIYVNNSISGEGRKKGLLIDGRGV